MWSLAKYAGWTGGHISMMSEILLQQFAETAWKTVVTRENGSYQGFSQAPAPIIIIQGGKIRLG